MPCAHGSDDRVHDDETASDDALARARRRKKSAGKFLSYLSEKSLLGRGKKKEKKVRNAVRPATKENETRATYFAASRVFQWICAWLLARVSIFICLHSTEHLRKAAAEVEARRPNSPSSTGIGGGGGGTKPACAFGIGVVCLQTRQKEAEVVYR